MVGWLWCLFRLSSRSRLRCFGRVFVCRVLIRRRLRVVRWFLFFRGGRRFSLGGLSWLRRLLLLVLWRWGRRGRGRVLWIMLVLIGCCLFLGWMLPRLLSCRLIVGWRRRRLSIVRCWRIRVSGRLRRRTRVVYVRVVVFLVGMLIGLVSGLICLLSRLLRFCGMSTRVSMRVGLLLRMSRLRRWLWCGCLSCFGERIRRCWS